MTAKTTCDLPDYELWLIRTMQQLNFGQITVRVTEGRPVNQPPPRQIRTIKVGGQNGPRPELDTATFALKADVVELLRNLRGVKDGRVTIQVRHGLPFIIEIEEEHQA